jgi:multiple sugar transport system permease protein
MLSMAFMSRQDIIDPEVMWIPTSLTFTNFRVAAFVMNMPKALWSTLWFTLVLASCQTLVTAMTGFALARFNFAFKKLWFVMILISFVIPIPIVIIPRIMMFITIQDQFSLQMIGTVIPQLFMTSLGQGVNSAIAILIFYNFFKMIPLSLDEAAQIDGASAIQVFYHIILKMSVTVITIVFLFSFVWNWNETYIATTFVRSGIDLLSLRLAAFDSAFARMGSAIPGQAGVARINEAYKMAATFLSMLPLLVLYLFSQKKFIEGIENAGVTGE